MGMKGNIDMTFKFKPANTTARTAAPTPPPRRAGRYSGVRSFEGRNPNLGEGQYVLQVIRTGETNTPGKDPYFIAELLVVTSTNPAHAPGTKCAFSQCLSSKAFSVGGGRVRAFAVAAAGAESDDAFDAGMGSIERADAFVDAVGGFSDTEFGDNPLEGAFVKCAAFPTGKLHEPTGTPYMNQNWSPVTEEEAAEYQAIVARF